MLLAQRSAQQCRYSRTRQKSLQWAHTIAAQALNQKIHTEDSQPGVLGGKALSRSAMETVLSGGQDPRLAESTAW